MKIRAVECAMIHGRKWKEILLIWLNDKIFFKGNCFLVNFILSSIVFSWLYFFSWIYLLYIYIYSAVVNNEGRSESGWQEFDRFRQLGYIACTVKRSEASSSLARRGFEVDLLGILPILNNVVGRARTFRGRRGLNEHFSTRPKVRIYRSHVVFSRRYVDELLH